jgi:hypothetical protein
LLRQTSGSVHTVRPAAALHQPVLRNSVSPASFVIAVLTSWQYSLLHRIIYGLETFGFWICYTNSINTLQCCLARCPIYRGMSRHSSLSMARLLVFCAALVAVRLL